MYQTVEAIVEPSGTVRLLEALHVDHPCRAVVTLLEAMPEAAAQATGDATDILHFLDQNRLPPSARLGASEIDAQIQEERNAWD